MYEANLYKSFKLEQPVFMLKERFSLCFQSTAVLKRSQCFYNSILTAFSLIFSAL